MIFQTKAKVIKNIEVAPKYYKMILQASGIAKQAQPGQFVNIRVSDKYEPLLRRPFSIHRIREQRTDNRKQIEILYEVIGKGTQILSRKKTGEYLDIVGPLGNGFSLATTNQQPATRNLLVAGGIGVAPIVFLAEKLSEIRKQKTEVRNILLIGAKTKTDILCERQFKKLNFEVKVATEDGSRGFKGFVSELLKKVLATSSKQQATSKNKKSVVCSLKPVAVYACGPKPMLKEIAKISKRYRIPAQISLEEHMACGVGACFGCVVNTKDGYKRVCKEGPVFSARDIKF